jgi:hypothetical protein
MENTWEQAYKELIEFVDAHPEIVITANTTRLPDEVRDDFYRRFDSARAAFVKERFPAFASEAQAISRIYLPLEDEIIKLLGLSEVSMDNDTHRILKDPLAQLIRPVFDPLFMLLKDQTHSENFEFSSKQKIISAFSSLYNQEYEKWVVFSLIKLLNPDKLFEVIPRPFSSEFETITISTSQNNERLPYPKESRALVFKDGMPSTLVCPDFIIHSPRNNKYIGIRSSYGRALGKASYYNHARNWRSLDSVPDLNKGLSLIYLDDNPENIALIADADKICEPDLILECKGNKGWYHAADILSEIEWLNACYFSLKPKLGTYIVSREKPPQELLAKLEKGIHVLTTEFDSEKLSPLADALAVVTDKAGIHDKV